MSPTGERRNATSEVVPTSHVDRSVDWDAMVRQAFLEGCLQQGVRAKLTAQAVASAGNPEAEQQLRNAANDAKHRAAVAWLTIEACLEQYGELAALALERCIEEASLQIRRTIPPVSPDRSGDPLARHEPPALSIVERGRKRLARFWGSSDTSAA
jgi:hypothetical protein